MLFGRAVQRPSDSLLKSTSLPGATSGLPSAFVLPVSHPAIQSNTSFETFVLLQTTTKTGGVRPLARAFSLVCHASNAFS